MYTDVWILYISSNKLKIWELVARKVPANIHTLMFLNSPDDTFLKIEKTIRNCAIYKKSGMEIFRGGGKKVSLVEPVSRCRKRWLIMWETGEDISNRLIFLWGIGFPVNAALNSEGVHPLWSCGQQGVVGVFLLQNG